MLRMMTVVESAAVVPGDQPNGTPTKRARSTEGHTDRQRDAAAVDDAAQHVAAELIGAQRVIPARTLEGVGLVAGDRALRREHVREEREPPAGGRRWPRR